MIPSHLSNQLPTLPSGLSSHPLRIGIMSWFRQRREKRPKSSTGPSCANTLYPPVGGGAAQSSESLARSRSPSPSPSPTPNSVRIVPVVEHSRDLWKEAFDSLDKDQCDTLQDGASMGTQDAICTVDTVIDLTEREYKDYCTRGWHIKKGDKTKETNVRIRAKEILCSALQFKDIIDRGLKFDPSGYGTIVWGVVSGGLQLLQNDTDRAEAIFDSAAEMAKILPKYAVVEAQYRDWPLQEQAAFEGRIVAVYSALLLYAAEVKKGLDKSFAGTNPWPRICVISQLTLGRQASCQLLEHREPDHYFSTRWLDEEKRGGYRHVTPCSSSTAQDGVFKARQESHRVAGPNGWCCGEAFGNGEKQHPELAIRRGTFRRQTYQTYQTFRHAAFLAGSG